MPLSSKNLITGILFLLLFNACTIQKRVHLKGYHIVWNKHKSKSKESDQNTVVAQHQLMKSEHPELLANGNVTDDIKDLAISKKPQIKFDADTCGDVIFLKNGESVVAKISEITETEIKYKRCDYLTGPDFILKKSKVALIQFSNGVKETVDVPEEIKQPVYVNTQQSPQYVQSQQETNSAGVTAFVCAIAGIFLILPYLIAIPFGIVSLQQFNKYPGKYKDKWMPRTALGIVAFFFITVGLIVAAVGFFSSDPSIMSIGGGIAVFGMLCLMALLIYD